MNRKTAKIQMVAIIMLAAKGISVTAHADDTILDRSLSVGMGAGFAPEYQGAKDWLGGPMPLVNARWGRFHIDDGFLFDIARSVSGDLSIGMGYDFGRHDHRGTWHGAAGSDYLKGMGNIDGAPTVNLVTHKIIGLFPFGALQATAGATQWIGGNKFTLINAGVSLVMPVSERVTVETTAVYTWGNQSYMQSYFGVNALQATQSKFNEYKLSAGSKDINTSVQVSYMIHPRWTIVTHVAESALLHEARHSPIVQRRGGINGYVVAMFKIR